VHPCARASVDDCYCELMTSVELRWTTELTPADYADLAALFDSEYADEWAPGSNWSPSPTNAVFWAAEQASAWPHRAGNDP